MDPNVIVPIVALITIFGSPVAILYVWKHFKLKERELALESGEVADERYKQLEGRLVRMEKLLGSMQSEESARCRRRPRRASTSTCPRRAATRTRVEAAGAHRPRRRRDRIPAGGAGIALDLKAFRAAGVWGAAAIAANHGPVDARGEARRRGRAGARSRTESKRCSATSTSGRSRPGALGSLANVRVLSEVAARSPRVAVVVESGDGGFARRRFGVADSTAAPGRRRSFASRARPRW